MGGAQPHRPRARRAVHDGADRRARPCEPRRSPSARRWGSTRRASGRKRASRAMARPDRDGRGDEGEQWTRCGRSWGLRSEGDRRWRGESLLVRYVNFVRLPHTVFALPFALLGVVVASREPPSRWRIVGLVALAFTAARFVAMGFNRIADRELDARNPRTRSRELPAGRLSLGQAWAAVIVAAVAVRVGRMGAQPALLRALPRRPRGRHAVQLRQALHLVVAPVARSGRRDRRPGGLPRRLGRVEHAVVAAVGAGGGGDVLGRRLRHLLRAAGRALRPRAKACIRRWSASARRAAFCSPSCCTASPSSRCCCSAGGPGSVGPTTSASAIGARVIAYEHRLVKPGDLSRLERGVLHDERDHQRRRVSRRAGGSDCCETGTRDGGRGTR